MASSSVTFSASLVQIQGCMGKYPLRDGNAIRGLSHTNLFTTIITIVIIIIVKTGVYNEGHC